MRRERDRYKILRAGLMLGLRNRLNRVENMTMAGMPDVNYCFEGKEGWLELKAPDEPAKNTSRIFSKGHRLEQAQKNWILTQRNAGGRVYILIMTNDRWILIHGKHADNLNEWSLIDCLKNCCWQATVPLGYNDFVELRTELMT